MMNRMMSILSLAVLLTACGSDTPDGAAGSDTATDGSDAEFVAGNTHLVANPQPMKAYLCPRASNG
jgi:hypothetical protein